MGQYIKRRRRKNCTFFYVFVEKTRSTLYKNGAVEGACPRDSPSRTSDKIVVLIFFCSGNGYFRNRKKSRTSEEMRSQLGYILQICLWEKILQVGGGGGSKSDFWEKSYPLAIFWNIFIFCVVRFDQPQVGVL